VAGRAAASYLQGNLERRRQSIEIESGSGINYVLPGRLTYEPGDSDILKLYFRVKSPLENASILVTDGEGERIASYSRKVVTPGEMETVKLPYQLLKDDMSEIRVGLDYSQ